MNGENCRFSYWVNTGGCYDRKCKHTYCDCTGYCDKWEKKMYIIRIDRPKRSIEDHHPQGTTVTLELTYSECVLIDHALHEYEKHHTLTKDQKWFDYEFTSLREILKQGTITSLIPLIYNETFGEEKSEEEIK